jgi:integrase/recombinase XerC
MKRSTPDRSFQPAVERFLTHLAAKEKSANTIRCYKADLAAFAAWYAKTAEEPLAELLQITAVELREWKRDMIARSQKPASVNRRLSAVQSFVRWAAEAGLIPGAPDRPASVRQERPGPKWLDKKDRLAFLRVVERRGTARNRAIASVLLNTGLRAAEMAALVWSDVTISERKGLLVVRSGKGAKYREIPLNDDARKAFKSIGYAGQAGTNAAVWQGKFGPLTVEGIQRVIEDFAAAAEVEASCHTLRHTFCHDLLAAGVGLEKVASLAGHDSIETTRRYVEPSAADLQAAVEQLGDRRRPA